MAKFVVYSHERTFPESNMFKICTCETKEAAEYVINALEYRDTYGRDDKSGPYDYYIQQI